MKPSDAAAAGALDNPPSRKGTARRLAEISGVLTPALDALSNVVDQFGGTLTTAIEIEGHLFHKRSTSSRFVLRLREPEEQSDGSR